MSLDGILKGKIFVNDNKVTTGPLVIKMETLLLVRIPLVYLRSHRLYVWL